MIKLMLIHVSLLNLSSSLKTPSMIKMYTSANLDSFLIIRFNSQGLFFNDIDK